MSYLSRRQLILGATGVAVVAAATPHFALARAAAAPAPSGPFKADPLPYPFGALEPFIDAQTMQFHHDRHHQGAVTILNEIARENPQIADKPIVEVLGNLGAVPEAIRTGVRNNMGAHANHTMFWQIMAPHGGKPGGEALAAIDRDLGGMEKFQTDFNAAGGRVFGSGWVFVTVDSSGRLAIETRPNQDNPIMDGKRMLLGNDVWEHAYYLRYQNRRPDYLKAWWNTVNWKVVDERYVAARAGTLKI